MIGAMKCQFTNPNNVKNKLRNWKNRKLFSALGPRFQALLNFDWLDEEFDRRMIEPTFDSSLSNNKSFNLNAKSFNIKNLLKSCALKKSYSKTCEPPKSYAIDHRQSKQIKDQVLRILHSNEMPKLANELPELNIVSYFYTRLFCKYLDDDYCEIPYNFFDHTLLSIAEQTIQKVVQSNWMRVYELKIRVSFRLIVIRTNDFIFSAAQVRWKRWTTTNWR